MSCSSNKKQILLDALKSGPKTGPELRDIELKNGIDPNEGWRCLEELRRAGIIGKFKKGNYHAAPAIYCLTNHQNQINRNEWILGNVKYYV